MSVGSPGGGVRAGSGTDENPPLLLGSSKQFSMVNDEGSAVSVMVAAGKKIASFRI